MDWSAPITSKSNARVKALRAALSGKARQPGDLLGLEGEHLIHEASLAHHELETVYFREGSERLLEKATRAGLRAKQTVLLSAEVFDSAVSTTSPQGIAATWIIRDPEQPSPQENALLLEDLQDPGNLGTLIRSAHGFGFGRVMVTPDTANHWNPKAVRAASGSIFRVPVVRHTLQDIVAQLRLEGVRIFAAVAQFNWSPECGSPVFAAPHGVLTGRVDNHLAPEGGRYNLPAPPKSGGSYAASNSFDTDFVEPCAILIGNEGAGLSAEARRLADEQVSIPCSAESLNAAVAGSILMYEQMRQRTLRIWARKQGLRP
jgi:TrmH family RNA methyltransferase